MTESGVRLLSLETRLLREICASTTGADLARIAGQLHDYSWRNRDHQIVFEALTRIKFVAGSSLREQLAAETTRMGFPDIDWDDYFPPGAAGKTPADENESEQIVSALIRELKSAAAQSE